MLWKVSIERIELNMQNLNPVSRTQLHSNIHFDLYISNRIYPLAEQRITVRLILCVLYVFPRNFK